MEKNKRSLHTADFIKMLNEETKFKFENSSWGNDEVDSAYDEANDLKVMFPIQGSDEFYSFVIYPEYSKGDTNKEIVVSTLDDVIKELNKLNIKENNMAQDNEIIIGTKVVFKDKAGKAIMNEWLDLSGQTGEVVNVLRRSDGQIKEVFVKLDKYDSVLDEWENQAIWSDGDDIVDFLSMIEIVKNEPLTVQEQIDWLNNFIIRWEKFMDKPGDNFDEEGKLMAEYEQFLMSNNLPNLSADELLRIIQRLNNLKGLDVIVNDNITGERYKSKIKSVSIAQDGKYVDVWVDDKAYVSDIENIMFLESGQNAAGQDVVFNPDVASFEEEEKTAFNDANKFVEEFKGYLIGKTIKNKSRGITDKITNVELSQDGNTMVDIHSKHVTIVLMESEFKQFIDGEDISIDGITYCLILQDEIKEEIMELEKINQLDYKYYVINTKTKKIQSGWEYKEDADDNLKELIEFGQKDLSVHSKKSIKSLDIDPDDNSNWGSSKDNYSIIKEALDFGVTEGDYDQADADNYLSVYESSGKYISVIKARLVYYLEHADKHFKQAILNSQYEKALRFLETKSKISEELLKIIKKDI